MSAEELPDCPICGKKVTFICPNDWVKAQEHSKENEDLKARLEQYEKLELPHDAYARGVKNGFDACKRMAVEKIKVGLHDCDGKPIADMKGHSHFCTECRVRLYAIEAIEALKPEVRK